MLGWYEVQFCSKTHNIFYACILLCIINESSINYFISYKKYFQLFKYSHQQVAERIWSQRLHFPRERPVEGGGVVVEMQRGQLRQLAQLRRDGSSESVFKETQLG